MIAAEVLFQREYIERTACARVVWDLTDKKQFCVVKPQKPPPHPKPDVSMLLALERKRLVFRGGSFCDDKTNGCVRRLLVLFGISQTKKKLSSKTTEMPPVLFDVSL